MALFSGRFRSIAEYVIHVTMQTRYDPFFETGALMQSPAFDYL
jgi:hypothetical protein